MDTIYNINEINLLLEMLRKTGVKEGATNKDAFYTNKDAFYKSNQGIYRFLSRRLNSGVFSGEFKKTVTSERYRRFIEHFKTYYAAEYTLMYDNSIEDMPLHINDPEYGLIASWRLKIGRQSLNGIF